jgi:hypothetical protein
MRVATRPTAWLSHPVLLATVLLFGVAALVLMLLDITNLL